MGIGTVGCIPKFGDLYNRWKYSQIWEFIQLRIFLNLEIYSVGNISEILEFINLGIFLNL